MLQCNNRLRLSKFFKIIIFYLTLLGIGVISGCHVQKSNRSVPLVRLHNNNQNITEISDYKVKRGDTIYSIAWRYSLDFKALASQNGINHNFNIKPGQILKLYPRKDPIIHSSQPLDLNNSKELINKKNNKQVRVKVNSQQHSVSNSLNTEKKSVTKWIWPVKGKLVARYSTSRGGNKGIDIQTSGPKAVHAIAAGTVVYSGEGLRGYGKLVIVKHNDNFLSAYAYNSAIKVKEKTRVKVGQVIADTGIKGLHKNRLHLEIRFKGKPVNPLIYLKQLDD